MTSISDFQSTRLRFEGLEGAGMGAVSSIDRFNVDLRWRASGRFVIVGTREVDDALIDVVGRGGGGAIIAMTVDVRTEHLCNIGSDFDVMRWLK